MGDAGGALSGASLLARERARAGFVPETMAALLHGGVQQLARRRWIFSAHEGVAAEVHAEKVREEQVAWSAEHFLTTHEPHLGTSYKPRDMDMQHMSDARISNSNLTINFGVFASTLRSNCSDAQKAVWLERAQKGRLIGAYAQTEIAHGSNVRGLATTCTYDPLTETWLVEQPSVGAVKWWSTGLSMATHCALFAQAIVGGKNMGVFPFMVQLRDENLDPLPGIEVGDIGEPLGERDSTIGFCRFSQLRIPRRALLEKRQHVTPAGVWTAGPEPGSMLPPASGKKQQGQEGDGAKPLSAKAAQSLKYLTMLKTRVGLASTAAGALAKACTIATRYSVQRVQGWTDSAGGAERQVVDYTNQQWRLSRWLASAYAFKSVAMGLVRRRRAIESDGDVDLDELPEVHALGSGLKSELTMEAALGIEDLRKSCGGHGYLMSSGIAPLAVDFTGPNATAEGDPIVLFLQTARFLVKEFRAARAGKPVHGLAKIFEAVKDPAFEPTRDGRRLLGVEDRPRVADLRNHAYLLRLFQWRSLVCTARAVRRLDALEKTLGPEEAWNTAARLLVKAAQCHVRFFIINGFAALVHDTADQACKDVLANLCALYGVADLLEGIAVHWGPLLADEDAAETLELAAAELCARLRPDLVALTDAFDFPDRVLNSGKLLARAPDVATQTTRRDRPATLTVLARPCHAYNTQCSGLRKEVMRRRCSRRRASRRSTTPRTSTAVRASRSTSQRSSASSTSTSFAMATAVFPTST
jgi:acyl-CoA oxidase